MIHNINKSYILFLLCCFIWPKFQLAPMLVDVYIDTNKTYNQILRVKNNDTKNLALKVYLRDKAFIDGVEKELPPGSFNRSIANWIDYSPKDLNIPPLQTQEIRLSINVPDSAKGTYWAYLFIEDSVPAEMRQYQVGEHQLNLGLNMRMGTMIRNTIPGTSLLGGRVETIQFKNGNAEIPEEIGFSFYNTGNQVIKAQSQIEFRDIDGLTANTTYISNIPKIYPTERRFFKIPVPNDLESGEYSALAIVDYGGPQLVAGEVIFEHTYYDCKGKPDGSSKPDQCGICDGDNSTCTDCKGIINGTNMVDCLGVCDGTAIVDCTGTCQGNALIDECGVCEGDNSTCTDCNGIPNGTTTLDCNGVCGGKAKVDDCGVCGGDNSSCDNEE